MAQGESISGNEVEKKIIKFLDNKLLIDLRLQIKKINLSYVWSEHK